jgi:hypothetical protein
MQACAKMKSQVNPREFSSQMAAPSFHLHTICIQKPKIAAKPPASAMA